MYDREIAGRTLGFGVSGRLYRNSLIMYDRQTETLWSHFLGAAVEGPLRGTRLEMIPSTFTTWGSWRAQHPGTLALAPRLAPHGGYGSDPYASYYRSGRTGILGTRRKDTRLEAKEVVLGVLAPAAKAYALRDVERLGTIRDELAGQQVEIRWDPVGESAAAFFADGTQLPSSPVFWFAWVDFFPGAPLYDSARVRSASR